MEKSSQVAQQLTTDATKLSPPPHYSCCITQMVMAEPVFTADGHTYEKEAIEAWLATNHTSPKTGLVLKDKTLTPNHDKRGEIATYLEQHPELIAECYLPKALINSLINSIKHQQIGEIIRQ